MDNKYYWYSASYKRGYDKEYGYEESVTQDHPFYESGQYRKLDQMSEYVLLNWREITEEDYNLFKKMENEL